MTTNRSTEQEHQKTKSDRLDFYRRYNPKIHQYGFSKEHPPKNNLWTIKRLLFNLGEIEDLLSLLKVENKSNFSWIPLTKHLYSLMPTGKVRNIFYSKWGLYIHAKDYYVLNSIGLEDAIDVFSEEHQKLTAAIESILNLPISSIDLLIETLGD